MKRINDSCDIQILVCVNERPASDPLPSCGHMRGHSFFNALRIATTAWAARLGVRVWVNRTICQGFCSKTGVSVSVFPGQLRWHSVSESDIAEILKSIETEIIPRNC